MDELMSNFDGEMRSGQISNQGGEMEGTRSAAREVKPFGSNAGSQEQGKRPCEMRGYKGAKQGF